MTEVDDSMKKYQPLTEDLVCKALKKDKGDGAELVSWTIKDFTKKGDNYACFVTSVKVQYKLGDKCIQEASYVAKISHQIESSFKEMMNEVFQKEGGFFFDILPVINDALRDLDMDDIRAAKSYAMSLEIGKEVLMLEDLRPRRFKMFDRKRGIDVVHANLVLKELGRLHAGSLLAEKKLGCLLTEKWPVIIEKWLQEDEGITTNLFNKLIESQMETSAQIMEKFSRYEKVVTWIRQAKFSAMKIFKDGLKSGTKFDVLNHGDCWNNNLLFRYNDEGLPIEVMMVDFQGVRKASGAADLSYFLYSSFTGDVRTNNLQAFLETYYESFTSVLREAQMPIPFSLSELAQEFKKKMILGCISGIILVPIVLSEEEDVFNFMDINEDNMNKNISEQQEKILKMSEREDGKLQDRFLSMFDEMLKEGVISDGDEAVL